MWRGAEAPPGHPAVWKRLQAWPRNCPCSKVPRRWQSTKTGLNWASHSHMQNPTPPSKRRSLRALAGRNKAAR